MPKNCESRGDLGAPCLLRVKQPWEGESGWRAPLGMGGRRPSSSHRSGSLNCGRGSLQVLMITEIACQEMLSEERKGKMSSFVNRSLVGWIKLEGWVYNARFESSCLHPLCLNQLVFTTMKCFIEVPWAQTLNHHPVKAIVSPVGTEMQDFTRPISPRYWNLQYIDGVVRWAVRKEPYPVGITRWLDARKPLLQVQSTPLI